jgi:NAD-dependent SIR2 family protein deacetylase
MQMPCEKYICEHGKIKPGYSLEDFKKVRFEDVRQYTEREGIEELKPCEECKKAV